MPTIFIYFSLKSSTLRKKKTDHEVNDEQRKNRETCEEQNNNRIVERVRQRT